MGKKTETGNQQTEAERHIYSPTNWPPEHKIDEPKDCKPKLNQHVDKQTEKQTQATDNKTKQQTKRQHKRQFTRKDASLPHCDHPTAMHPLQS